MGDYVLPRTENTIMLLLRAFALSVGLAVATGLAAGVKMEIGIVPITLQTFAVLMSGVLFGSRIGASSQLAYLLAGLAGVPWFSRGGGIGYLLSPTFGYVVGFVAAAYAVGFLAERGWDKSVAGSVGAMAAGIIIIYCFGLVWLAKFLPSESLLAIGVYPFLAADVLKVAAAGLILPLCRKIAEGRIRFGI